MGGRGKEQGALKRRNLSHFQNYLLLLGCIQVFCISSIFDVVKIVLIFCPNLAKWTNKLSDYKQAKVAARVDVDCIC